MKIVYNKHEIGKRLKKLRESKNLSQYQLADELAYNYPLGIQQGSISKHETGGCDLSVYSLVVYADYFGVTTDYILWGK